MNWRRIARDWWAVAALGGAALGGAAAGGLAGCDKVGPGLPAAVAPAPCPGGEQRGALTWLEDDLEGARACAERRGVPLVVDLWAPWCHTCLSMAQYVLTDPALAPFADRFVFVGIDTDKPSAAAVVDKLPPAAWPTYFVVAPDDLAVEARFVGAATVAQWKDFLAQGEAGYLDARAGSMPAGSPLALVRAGDRAAAAHDGAAAERAYAAALAAAPADWPRRADVRVAQIGARQKAGDAAGCVALGLEAMDETGRSSSATDFLVTALGCADELGDAAATRDQVRALRERAAARLAALAADASAPLSVDDRSDAYEQLRGVDLALGRADDARAAATAQAQLLDHAVAHAPTAAAAATYNYQRADAYVFLGKALAIVPALEQSARDLPDEYDPPYRLAWVLLQAGQPDEAKLWIEKAERLMYGPRKARALAIDADIEKARGDRAAERAARQAIVDLYAGLPASQVPHGALDKARAQLAAMDQAPAPAPAPSPAPPAPSPPAPAAR